MMIKGVDHRGSSAIGHTLCIISAAPAAAAAAPTFTSAQRNRVRPPSSTYSPPSCVGVCLYVRQVCAEGMLEGA